MSRITVGYPHGRGSIFREASTLPELAADKPRPKRISTAPMGGIRNRNAKLTPDQVREILRRHMAGGKGSYPRVIARDMKLPYHQVRGVIEGGNGTRTCYL